MKSFVVLAMLLVMSTILVGCGKCKDKEYVVGPTQTVSVPVVEDEVAEVVQEVNDLRFAQGQLPLALGLSCSLYNNTGGAGVFPIGSAAFPASLPSAVISFVYLGDINQPDSSVASGLNILPAAVRPSYTQWYAVRCTGQLVAPTSDYQSFNLRSDDASNLYIDNVLTVNNDGNHGPTTKNGYKFLSRGIHSIRIDYMQGPGGSQSLQLDIPGSRLYR